MLSVLALVLTGLHLVTAECDNRCGATTTCINNTCVAFCNNKNKCCAPLNCDDVGITECVGAFDTFCLTQWDTQCAEEAKEVCGLQCGTSTPNPISGILPVTPNYSGVLTWGNCLLPKPNVYGLYGTGQFSQCQCCPSSPQCKLDHDNEEPWQPIPAPVPPLPPSCQFSTCQQSFAFPYYYYDKFIGRVFHQTEHAPSTLLPHQLESTAMTAAQNFCEEVMANMDEYKWEGLPAARLANVRTLAWIWLSANIDNPKKLPDCAAALVIVFGECQNELMNDGHFGCQVEKFSDPWQSGSQDGPLLSAQMVYEERCVGAAATVPDGSISSGNKNYMEAWSGVAWVPGTTFCHHNQWSGAGFGGGMCAGGLI